MARGARVGLRKIGACQSLHVCLRGENIAELNLQGSVEHQEGARHDHRRTRSDFRNAILRRASRDSDIFTRAATPNRLCFCIGRTLAKNLLPSAKFLTEKFFEEFLFNKLINNTVIDDSRCESIGSNALYLIEFQQHWNRPGIEAGDTLGVGSYQ
jgi:hypothetical protein